MAGANWKKIKTEYITTQISYRKLAQKHGVPFRTLSDRAKAEGWVELRREHRDKTVSMACEKISQQQSEQIAGLVTDAAQQLLEKAFRAIEQLDRPIRSHKEVVEDGDITTTTEWESLEELPGAVNVLGVRQLATALKDISQVLGLKTELDRQEQEARIAALRAKSAEEDPDDSRIEVVFDAGPEEWNE